MLRSYYLQKGCSLSDEPLEDSLCDIADRREFVGIDLGREAIPDATTLLKFRRLMQRSSLTVQMLSAINTDLSTCGLLMKSGTIVDTTLIDAPISIKNSSGSRTQRGTRPSEATSGTLA